jgi:hypothetical protein
LNIIYSWELKLSQSLSEKTGLKLFFNDDGRLSYEKDNDGKPIVQTNVKYSESARKDLLKVIDSETFIYEIKWSQSNDINGGASSFRKSQSDSYGYVYMDISDFKKTNQPYYDMGMVFLHEIQHGFLVYKTIISVQN